MGRDGVGVAGPSSSPTNNDQAVINLTITQGMMSTYLQFLQVQTQTGKMKLEYLRRREEREEKESAQRREMERIKLEREVAEFEHNKQKTNMQQKADRALVRIPFWGLRWVS
jgi:histone acetyltransferase MYST4